MRPWLRATLCFLLAAVIAHGASVYLYPRLAMHAAIGKIGRHGSRVGTWIHTARATSASRTVVRPSPDLAYSICIYDLARGPLRIHVAPWNGYWSLSLYAADSDNYRTLSDRDHPDGVDVVLVPSTASATGVDRIVSPSRTGIAVVRRLAVDREAWDEVMKVRAGDVCRFEP